MSLCIHRKPGLITMKPMCSEQVRSCPWWRAMICIPWDLAKAMFRHMWRMLFLA